MSGQPPKPLVCSSPFLSTPLSCDMIFHLPASALSLSLSPRRQSANSSILEVISAMFSFSTCHAMPCQQERRRRESKSPKKKRAFYRWKFTLPHEIVWFGETPARGGGYLQHTIRTREIQKAGRLRVCMFLRVCVMAFTYPFSSPAHPQPPCSRHQRHTTSTTHVSGC